MSFAVAVALLIFLLRKAIVEFAFLVILSVCFPKTCHYWWLLQDTLHQSSQQSKKISNDQELIQSDPTSCPQNQKGNN